MIDIPFNFRGSVAYQSYSDLEERLKKFDKLYTIGKDESGEYDMYLIELGTRGKPTLFLTSSMHGTEWHSTQYGMKFMEDLRDNTFADTNFRDFLLNNFCIAFIPVINPWGYDRITPENEYAQFNNLARYTSNGTELNGDFYSITQQETKNVVAQIDKYKPFAYVDMHMFQPEYNVSYERRLILANGQRETDYVRDEWRASIENYLGEQITIWTNTLSPTSGLARAYAARTVNPHTPHTLAYITELVRPADVRGERIEPLTKAEIFQYGTAQLYLFFKTSIDYYLKNFKVQHYDSQMMYVRDLEGNEYHLQATSTHDFSLNGNQSLSFTVKSSRTNNKFIKELSEMWEVVDDKGVTHKIVYCKRQGVGVYDGDYKLEDTGSFLTPVLHTDDLSDSPKEYKRYMNVEVKAIPKFFDVLDNMRYKVEYNEHMTAQRAFTRIFDGTGFEFILVGHFDAVDWEGFGGHETRLETFKRALDRYKMEFRIEGNVVYLERQIGRDTSFQYRYRLNASNIVQEIDANEFWTFARGYGDYGDGEGGEDWQNAKLIREYTSPLAKILGIREAPPIANGNITREEKMDEELKELVDNSLKVSVSADIHDLRKQGYALAQPEMGDRVFIIDERIGLDQEIRVNDLSVTKDWMGNVLDSSVTFGNEGLSKRRQASINTATKNINDILSGRKTLPFSALDAAVQNATRALQNVQTELDFTGIGIIGRDKDNPNYLTLFSGRGLGVSDDGGNTFTEAIIAGLGINASAIVTGSLVADFIAGGMLSSLNGRTNFNLDTGLLTMESTQFILGGGADIRFTSRSNNLYYENENVYAGIKFDQSLNGGGRPIAAFGVSNGALDVNHSSWNGLRVHSRWVENNVPGVMTNIVSNELWLSEDGNHLNGGWRIQNKYDGTKARSLYGAGDFPYNLGTDTSIFARVYTNRVEGAGGILFKTTWDSQIGWNMKLSYDGESHIRFYPQYTGSYYYSIGAPNNRVETGYFNQLRGRSVGSSSSPYDYVYGDRIFGTVAGTSTHNSKMNIENLDGQEAFDYFDTMIVRSYYYKDADITNKYNRKVSPIIEQLEPSLANLYKATDYSLDINSNLFLLVKAFQHHIKMTDDRFKQIEEAIA